MDLQLCALDLELYCSFVIEAPIRSKFTWQVNPLAWLKSPKLQESPSLTVDGTVLDSAHAGAFMCLGVITGLWYPLGRSIPERSTNLSLEWSLTTSNECCFTCPGRIKLSSCERRHTMEKSHLHRPTPIHYVLYRPQALCAYHKRILIKIQKR